jgi:hypothetical protein
MSIVYFELNKYFPRSKKGHQCITNCYSPGVIVQHPLKNKSNINYISSSCGIIPKKYKNKKGKTKKKAKYFDECWNPNYNSLNSDSILYTISPDLHFCKVVMNKVYGIKSYNDAITFINMNPTMSEKFKDKIIKCAYLMYEP